MERDVKLRRLANGYWQVESAISDEPILTILPHAALHTWNSLTHNVTYRHGQTIEWLTRPECLESRRI